MGLDTDIGFTGTREGMTPAQKSTVMDLLGWDQGTVHHGDCIGADTDMHHIAREHGYRIVGHPPIKTTLRAFNECDELREPGHYLARDRDIVDESEILVATPKETEENWTGGTWYTVHYALGQGLLVHLVWPDGRHEVRRGAT